MVATLNNAQLTLLELLSEPLSQEDLEQLRATLIQFRYARLQKMLSDQWQEKGWSQEVLDKWYLEHHRTPYHQAVHS